MKQGYNSNYHPPIPALDIRLYSAVTDQFTETLSAILDIGSDASLVPLEHLLTIGRKKQHLVG